MKTFVHLNALLSIIFHKHFPATSYCVLFFSDRNFSAPIKFNGAFVNIKTENLSDLISNKNYGCKNVVIVSENPVEIFRKFEQTIKLAKVERYNERKFVVVDASENSGQFFATTDEIGHVCDLLVVRLEKSECLGNVILRNASETYSFYTHEFTGENWNKAVCLDKWFSENSSFLSGNALFPDKISNLRGKTIRAATFMYLPYSYVANGTFDGLETQFLLEFFKKHNATPFFNDTGEDLNYGNVYDNFTGDGLLGNLVEEKSDIGYGAVYRWDEVYKNLDISTSLIRGGCTCIVPAPKLKSGLILPFLSFNLEIWKGVITIFLTAVIFLFALYKFYHQIDITTRGENCWIKTLPYSVYTILRIFLGQPLRGFHAWTGFKIFILAVILEGLLISVLYNSGYASIMTIPRYERPILTIQDFVESGMLWGGTTEAFTKSLDNSKQEMYKKIVKRFFVSDEKSIIKMAELGKFGFGIERVQYGHYAFFPYVTREVLRDYRIMLEYLFWDLCVFVVRKNSVYLPSLNELIRRTFESGIVSYWENDASYKYTDNQVQRQLDYYYKHFSAHETVVTELNLIRIQGAFALLIGGHAVAFVSFVFEIASRKMKNKTK